MSPEYVRCSRVSPTQEITHGPCRRRAGGRAVRRRRARDWVRHCLCLGFSTAFVAKTLPLPCSPQALPVPRVSAAFVAKTAPFFRTPPHTQVHLRARAVDPEPGAGGAAAAAGRPAAGRSPSRRGHTQTRHVGSHAGHGNEFERHANLSFAWTTQRRSPPPRAAALIEAPGTGTVFHCPFTAFHCPFTAFHCGSAAPGASGWAGGRGGRVGQAMGRILLISLISNCAGSWSHSLHDLRRARSLKAELLSRRDQLSRR